MVARIVGLIVGTTAMLSPLCYLMMNDTFNAVIAAVRPDLGGQIIRYSANPVMLYAISAVGAIVLLASTIVMVLTARQQAAEKARAQSESSGSEL